MRARPAIALMLLLLPCFLLTAALVLCRARPFDTTAPRALAARLPAPDLALASGARYLRMPSLEERWAGFEDSPGLLDLDPAGGFFDPSAIAEGVPPRAP